MSSSDEVRQQIRESLGMVPAQGERLSHVGVHTRFVQKLSLTYYTHNISLRLFFTSASSRVSALS